MSPRPEDKNHLYEDWINVRAEIIIPEEAVLGAGIDIHQGQLNCSLRYLVNRHTSFKGSNSKTRFHFGRVVEKACLLTTCGCEVRFPKGTTISSLVGHTFPVEEITEGETGKKEYSLWISKEGSVPTETPEGVFKFEEEKAIVVPRKI